MGLWRCAGSTTGAVQLRTLQRSPCRPSAVCCPLTSRPTHACSPRLNGHAHGMTSLAELRITCWQSSAGVYVTPDVFVSMVMCSHMLCRYKCKQAVKVCSQNISQNTEERVPRRRVGDPSLALSTEFTLTLNSSLQPYAANYPVRCASAPHSMPMPRPSSATAHALRVCPVNPDRVPLCRRLDWLGSVLPVSA